MVSPERVTVKVNGVLPVIALGLACSRRRDRKRDGQRVVVEDGAGCGRGGDGGPSARALDSVTVKPSSASTVVSPATLTVMVWLVSPAAKLTVPGAARRR